MKKIKVVAAVIYHQHKILCVQRGDHPMKEVAFKWEFPGGKAEANESFESAIIREIKEELDMDIDVQGQLCRYAHHYKALSLDFIVLKCKLRGEDFQLREHIAYQWLPATQLKALDWAAADVPAVELLLSEGAD